MKVKIIEFTDKVTVTYEDGSVKVFVDESLAPEVPEVVVPLNKTIKLVAEE